MSFWKRGWLPFTANLLLIWVSLIPLPILAEIKIIWFDKFAHLVAFFILALLYLWAFDFKETAQRIAGNKNRKTFIITVFSGGLIELLQHYLPVNRFGDWIDFFFDIAGVILAIIIYPMFKQQVLKRTGLLILFLAALQTQGQSAFSDALKHQSELNAEFSNPETSPLDSADLAQFKGLDFFPIDTAYRVVARVYKIMDASFFGMPTTTSRRPEYRVWATVVFNLHGKEYQLKLYQNKKLMENPQYFDYLFLPFLDLTNGETTYGGGRYIDLRIPEGDAIIIDFNKAYNPSCAYNHRYSCPVVPEENSLDIAIKAGVKKFH